MKFVIWLVLVVANSSPALAELELRGNYPEGMFFEGDKVFYFAEMTSDRVEKVDRGTRSTFFEREGCGPTGVTKLDEKRFAIACHLEGSIIVLDDAGNILSTAKRSAEGHVLRNPNDINADGLGGAFFSDPGPFSLTAGNVGRVFRLLPDLSLRLVSGGLVYPNGVAYRKETRQLYVSEHLAKRITVINLQDDHVGHLTNSIFFDFRTDTNGYNWQGLTGPDGLRILETGDILVAIYGLGRVVLLHDCNRQTWFEVRPRYATSVGYSSGLIGIAGAFTNVHFPFEGMVGVYKLEVPTVCHAED